MGLRGGGPRLVVFNNRGDRPPITARDAVGARVKLGKNRNAIANKSHFLADRTLKRLWMKVE